MLLAAMPFAALAQNNTGVENQPNPYIKTLLADKSLQIEGTRILAEQTILDVYRDNDFRPMWTRPQVESLIRMIKTASDHGLDPADYNADALFTVLTQWLTDPTDEVRARAEILLTESLLRYAYHRRYGKAKANQIDPDINFRRQTFNGQAVSKNIHDAMASPSLDAFVEQAAPSGPYYHKLQHWLGVYRKIQAEGGWPTVPEGPTLRAGDESPRVAAIRAHLETAGYLDEPPGTRPAYFDTELQQAVRQFQLRHNLDADGVVGKMSIEAMNVPVESRADQIRISLERLRWADQERSDTQVAVNIAGFEALFFKDGELAWTTRAMVGKNYRKTPVFRGDIAYMEFNPTWTIPPGILRNDTLPAIKRDPNYLASKQIEVIDNKGKVIDPNTVNWKQYKNSVPYTLRQTPGPHNSLGTVKFIFPNEHFVFLHDTPHRELFDRPERAFSSGCIRIEDPLRLAELLLDDPLKYNRSSLQAIVDSRKTQRISLKPKIPVAILYLTAALDGDGQVTFMKDIYGRDPAVLAALDGPVIIDLPD